MSFFGSDGRPPPFRSSLDGGPQSPFGELARQREGFGEPEREGKREKPSSTDWSGHVALPLIVTGYIQALFNLVVLCGVLYGLYWFGCAIQLDIDLKAEQFRREVISEIQTCAREYVANRCEPGDRIPAMQKTCEAWKNCMEQDPFTVARGKISAHTIAEIFNSFVEPISYKTMIFVCLVLVTVVVGSNIGFGIGRRTLATTPMLPSGDQVVLYKKKKS